MEIMRRRWVKRSVLGKGSFGTVSLAVPTSDFINPADHAAVQSKKKKKNQEVVMAVKSAHVWSATSLLVEGRFLHQLRGCPQIVRCFGEDISVEKNEETYNLLLEYAPGGTLDDLIDDNYGSGLPEINVSCYAYMILKGLSYIHKKGYVHCDLKPANILVFPSTMFNDHIIKIADFGLAKKSGPLPAQDDCVDVKNMKLRDKVRGTALYNSPESVLLGQHEAPMDIWALGVTMIEMLTGGKSGYWEYQNKDDLVRQIALEEDLPEVPCISEEAREFVLMCLIRDPKQRWTADMLLKHPFITDNLILTHESYGGLGQQQELEVSPSPRTTNPLGVAADKWFSGRSLFSSAPLLPSPTTPKQYYYLPNQMMERYRELTCYR